MPATPVYALPYPAPADPADVPLDLQELAERVEAVLGAGPPGQELGYAQFTANVNISGTDEATANTIVTAPSVTLNGSTIVWVEFYCPWVQPSATVGDYIRFVLFDGAGSLGYLGNVMTPAAAPAVVAPVSLRRKLTPSAAAHVFSVRAFRSLANGLLSAGVGGPATTVPGFIRVVRG